MSETTRYLRAGIGKEEGMNRKRALVLAAALTAGLITWGVLPSAAQVPIFAEPLTPRAEFTDDVNLKVKVSYGGKTEVVMADDPSTTAVVKYTIQPGAQFPWHSHAGPVVVNVVQGSLVYVGADDCVEHEYQTGTAFVDLGHGHVHSAYNPSGTGETVLVATFFEAPASGPLLIPAPAASCVLP